MQLIQKFPRLRLPACRGALQKRCGSGLVAREQPRRTLQQVATRALRRAPQHRNAAFDTVFDPLAMDAATWLGMDEAAFEALCGRTPLTRSGLVRIRENALRNAAPEEPSER